MPKHISAFQPFAKEIIIYTYKKALYLMNKPGREGDTPWTSGPEVGFRPRPGMEVVP